MPFEHYYLDTVARGGGQIGGDSDAGFSDDVTQPIQRVPKAHRQGFLVVGFFVSSGRVDMQNPFIVGDRIYLRPLEMDDIDSFITWLNDQDVRHYLNRTSPLNRIREKDFVENLYKDDRDIVLGIVLKENDQLIGNIALHRISIPYRHAGLGIFIGNKDCWSKGYGTEALRLMMGYGFDQLNLHRIFLTVLGFNARAIRAYEKVGFKREGVFREHIYRDGKYHDIYYMGILESEWRDLNGTNL